MISFPKFWKNNEEKAFNSGFWDLKDAGSYYVDVVNLKHPSYQSLATHLHVCCSNSQPGVVSRELQLSK